MYGVIRIYKMKSAAKDIDKVVAATRDGFLPIVTKMPGFASYTMALSETGELVTIGFFLDRADAEESTRLAGEWVCDNVMWAVEGPPKTAGGEVRLQERLGHEASYGTVRRGKLQPGKMNEALALMRRELLPLLSSMPGFVTVAILESGPDEFLSVAAWRDRASAEEATRHAMAFLERSAAELVAGPPEMLDGELLLRRVNEPAIKS
jgi:hypothetical protein